MAASVGSRCFCEGCYGTVRFCGELQSAKGEWLGVEWDDPSRGKHSGSHEGVQYFTCKVSGSGSFIRPKKASFGVTFLTAMKKRYGHSLNVEEESEMFVLSKDGSKVTPVEMVGTDQIAEKQGDFTQLKDASLRGMDISSAGPEGQIREIFQNLTHLDLSQNLLLPSWNVVATITNQLPCLHCLDLSENTPLALCEVENQDIVTLGSSLKIMFLNKMGLTWTKACSILKMMPFGLEELHLCKNQIDGFGESMVLPSNLQLLNLEENKLTDWSEVLKLKHLVSLRTLILNENKFGAVFFPCTDGHTYFPSLESLSLGMTCIDSWSSINSIATLPSLCKLKFKNCPLVDADPPLQVRQLIVARIGQLTSLNGSTITRQERQTAEWCYLKRYITEWVRSRENDTSQQEFAKLHPRYTQLAKFYNLSEDSVKPDEHKGRGTALKDTLITVNIQCPGHPEMKAVVKKLPANMTIQSLKGLLQRLYKIDATCQKVSYCDKRGEKEIEYEMNDDLKTLSFYSVVAGDTILFRWS